MTPEPTADPGQAADDGPGSAGGLTDGSDPAGGDGGAGETDPAGDGGGSAALNVFIAASAVLVICAAIGVIGVIRTRKK